MRDTGLADRFRAAGLKVVEVDGWKTRGYDTLNPRGSVHHHTAGGRTGNAPSLNICINGRSDLPGPLCNWLTGRDNTIYVVAAGKANHAGAGGWKGLSGNSSVFGDEHENVGTNAEPWRPDQIEKAAIAHAAALRPYKISAEFVCQHFEWAPGRKSDAHDWDGPGFCALVAKYLASTPTPEAPDVTDPQAQQLTNVNDKVNALDIRTQQIQAAVEKLQSGAPSTGISDADVARIVKAVIAEIAS